MTHVAPTRATIRLSATTWREISTAAALTIMKAKPVQSSRTTARPTTVKVTFDKSNTSLTYSFTTANLCWCFLFPHFFHSDWQLHCCCGNQWHPKTGLAHLLQCVRPPRPLHQPACRELQLLLWPRIHRHLLPRKWVSVRLTAPRRLFFIITHPHGKPRSSYVFQTHNYTNHQSRSAKEGKCEHCRKIDLHPNCFDSLHVG